MYSFRLFVYLFIILTLIIGNKIDNTGVQYSASSNINLTHLDLSGIYLSLFIYYSNFIIGNEIAKDGVLLLAASTFTNSTLTYLDLRSINTILLKFRDFIKIF